MTERVKKYLSDIIVAIELIEEFTDSSSNFYEYQGDLKTQSAVERQLAIIGEALNKLKKEMPGLPVENAGKIIGFRNRLIHAYDNIDNAIVWAIIKKHLPRLKNEIKSLK